MGVSQRSIEEIESDLLLRLGAFDKATKLLWAVATAAFAIGAWTAGIQWQVALIRNDLDHLKDGTTLGAEKAFERINEDNQNRDKLIFSIQLNQQQLTDSVHNLTEMVREMRNDKK